ncbi:MAG TPA: RDD family protein [Sulfurovum sp.]|nr:RDD family protein [Sulfurovum sp.]
MTQTSSFDLASMQKRMASFVIDDIIISFFFMIIFYDQITALISTADAGGEISTVTMEMMNTFLAENIVIVFAIKVIYHTVLIWQNGMTIGKYIVKIKVISLHTEQRPTFQQAFLRASVRLISDTFFYLGYIMAFFMPLKQTLHDKLSNCVVVYA